MTIFSPFEIQKAICQALSGDAALMEMIGGVYDFVPENSAFPYITIGEVSGRDWSTKTTAGMNLVITIHVFSRSGGRKEALLIMGRVTDILHRSDLPLTDQYLIMMRFAKSDVLLGKDGLTYQGVLQFKALTEAA